MSHSQPRTHFKSAEGRYRLGYEHTHPTGLVNARNPQSTSLTLAVLRGAGDNDGAYLIANANDTLIISDYNTLDKEALKVIVFTGAHPTCHTYLPYQATDGYDLLIGMSSGEVYVASLRQQLVDPSRKLVGALMFNRDGSVDNSKCTSVLWSPRNDGAPYFISTHSNGNLYIYDKTKEGGSEPVFSPIKDPTSFQISHAKSVKSCPISRWHLCSGSINCAAFSHDGALLATGTQDGQLRIFDFSRGSLYCGGRSYYGAILSLAWSHDARFVAIGGQDDLVSIYSMSERCIVSWGEGHSSWVSDLAFDPFWIQPGPPSRSASISDDFDPDVYRIVSVSQDCQMALWEFCVEDAALVTRPPPTVPSPGTSSFFSQSPASTPKSIPSPSSSLTNSSPSAFHRRSTSLSSSQDIIASSTMMATLIAPSPTRSEVLRISPVMLRPLHQEPLTGLLCTEQALLTACQGAQVKLWLRPNVWSRLVAEGKVTAEEDPMRVEL